jgi:hypothetical protein
MAGESMGKLLSDRIKVIQICIIKIEEKQKSNKKCPLLTRIKFLVRKGYIL